MEEGKVGGKERKEGRGWWERGLGGVRVDFSTLSIDPAA